jgi:hypothetical protein
MQFATISKTITLLCLPRSLSIVPAAALLPPPPPQETTYLQPCAQRCIAADCEGRGSLFGR